MTKRIKTDGYFITWTLYIVSTDIPNQSVALVPVKWYEKQPLSVGPTIASTPNKELLECLILEST